MDADQERKFFAANGYLILPNLLSDEEVQTSRREIQRLHQRAAELSATGDPTARDFQREPYVKSQDHERLPMQPPTLVTTSIALDDAPLTEREDIDLSAQIYVPLQAGFALLFHSKLVHGSGHNQPAHSRNTALYAYFSPRVRYVPGPNAPRRRQFAVIAGLDGAQSHELVAN